MGVRRVMLVKTLHAQQQWISTMRYVCIHLFATQDRTQLITRERNCGLFCLSVCLCEYTTRKTKGEEKLKSERQRERETESKQEKKAREKESSHQTPAESERSDSAEKSCNSIAVSQHANATRYTHARAQERDHSNPSTCCDKNGERTT